MDLYHAFGQDHDSEDWTFMIVAENAQQAYDLYMECLGDIGVALNGNMPWAIHLIMSDIEGGTLMFDGPSVIDWYAFPCMIGHKGCDPCMKP